MVELLDRVVSPGRAFMRYVGPDRRSCRGLEIRSVTEMVEEERPGSVVFVTVNDEAQHYDMMWPQDALQTYGRRVVGAGSAVVRQLAFGCGLPDPVRSVLAEGGLVLKVDNRLFISSRIVGFKTDLALVQGDYHLSFLPYPTTSPRYRREDARDRSDVTHIDLDVAVLRDKDGRLAFLIGEAYHETYRDEVCALTDELEADRFVVPEEEVRRRACNLVDLPGGDVLVPADCPETCQFLEARRGAEHVLAVAVDPLFGYNGGRGGLRCMSTLLEVP